MPASPVILVTGFETFAEFKTNASQVVVEHLAEYTARGPVASRLYALHTDVLPVAGRVAPARLVERLEQLQPDIVLCLGIARVEQINVERVAVNLCDYRIPDRDGNQRIDEPIVEDGPTAYFSSLPVRAIVHACHEAGIPASISLTAGAYLCNEVFYTLRHWQNSRHDPSRRVAGAGATTPGISAIGGFIHLPLLPAEAARQSRPTPSMPLDLQLEAIAIAIATCIRASESHDSVV